MITNDIQIQKGDFCIMTEIATNQGNGLTVNDGSISITRMDFGDALHAIKDGKKVARKGWNGRGMFIYYVPPGNYAPCTDIARSLTKNGLVPYGDYIAIKTAQGNVVPWTPSQTDVLADDWVII